MGIGVSMRGVQVATQFFDEDPDRAAHISNRGVNEAKHELFIITVAPRNVRRQLIRSGAIAGLL